MALFEHDVRYNWMPTETAKVWEILRDMSLVHRSWTNTTQEFLFRRKKIPRNMDQEKLRGLLQHPYLSSIRELIYELPFNRGKEEDKEATDEAVDYAIRLLKRLRPLRYLSLRVSGSNRVLDDSSKMDCSNIYSQVSRHLPSLSVLLLTHHDVDGLRVCVESVLRGRMDQTPIALDQLEVSIDGKESLSGMLFSPAVLRPLNQSKGLECSEVDHDSQKVANLQPGSIGTRHVFIDFWERYPLGAVFSCLFDRDMRSAILGDIFPGIRRLAVRYPYTGKLEQVTDYDEVREEQQMGIDTNMHWFLSRLLNKCTALTHIDLVFSEDANFGMNTLPILDFPASTQVVSIYLPENGVEIGEGLWRGNFHIPGALLALFLIRQDPLPGSGVAWASVIDSIRMKRSRGLKHAVDDLFKRGVRPAMKRLEVMFCRELDSIVSQFGLDATVQDAKHKSHDIGVPGFLLPVNGACRANGVDFVVRESILFEKY